MSTVEPPDGPDSDALRAMIDGLNIQEPALRPPNEMDNRSLLDTYESVKHELRVLGELVTPQTERGRELHSLHGACLVELEKRNMR